MSFDTYQDLAEEVADLIGRGDLHSKVGGWLEFVEKELQTDLRDFRETLLEETGNFVAAQAYITMPVGFREAISIRIDTSPERRMSLVSHDKLIDIRVNGNNAGLSHPIAFAYGGERKILIEPAPSGTDAYTLLYHGYLGAIDGDKTSSQVLRDAPQMLLYGAAKHGCMYTRNWELKNEMDGEFVEQKSIYSRFLGRARMGGGEIRVVPDNVPQDAYSREFPRS